MAGMNFDELFKRGIIPFKGGWNGGQRDEIKTLIKEVMERDKGKAMKQKALEWKKKAMETTDIGGSSYKNFEMLIKEALYGPYGN
ncbi:hypothetical protein FH972_002630 [Carpinus fangiana]|uniref:Uncharacterized protein n=1 Tax=Carpinus fangiana TaxID=176857 RepID=A0A5N6QFF8_9ROSI|nr:hypothetical protein FH972_002630 [Carpinus fangiana]